MSIYGNEFDAAFAEAEVKTSNSTKPEDGKNLVQIQDPAIKKNSVGYYIEAKLYFPKNNWTETLFLNLNAQGAPSVKRFLSVVAPGFDDINKLAEVVANLDRGEAEINRVTSAKTDKNGYHYINYYFNTFKPASGRRVIKNEEVPF